MLSDLRSALTQSGLNFVRVPDYDSAYISFCNLLMVTPDLARPWRKGFTNEDRPQLGQAASGARSVLPRLIENLVFVRLAESSSMTFTWSRNNRTRR